MAKLSAFGVLLKRGATTVVNVKNLSGPGLSADTIDVSSHDQATAWREFIAGLIDGGEVTAEIDFDPAHASHTQILADLSARTKTSWNITFIGGGTHDLWTFDAFVSGFTPAAPVDGDQTASFTLKVAGQVTFA